MLKKIILCAICGLLSISSMLYVAAPAWASQQGFTDWCDSKADHICRVLNISSDGRIGVSGSRPPIEFMCQTENGAFALGTPSTPYFCQF